MKELWVSPSISRLGDDRVAKQDGVGHFQHRVGEDQEQGDVERHQRADNVLGLGVLATRGGNGRRDLGIDHGNGCVEQADDPAHDKGRQRAALVGGEIPAGEFADQNDTDAERPDMGGAEHPKQRNPVAIYCGTRSFDRDRHCSVPTQIRCFSEAASSSPSRDEVRTCSE